MKFTLLYARWPRRRALVRPRRWFPPYRRAIYYLRHRGYTFRLHWQPFMGICMTAWWEPMKVWLTSTPPKDVWEVPSMKKRAVAAGADGEPNKVPMESIVFKGHLPLVEHCACRRWEDGSPRQPGWITIGTAGGSWTVTVKEPDACASFRVVAPTLDQALDTATLLLACDEAPWEHDRFLQGQQTKQKKK